MISRRNFIGRGLSAFTAQTLLNLHLMSAAQASGSSSTKRGLICLYFPGGIDSYNMLVPMPGTPAWNTYQSDRGSLALSEAEVVRSATSATELGSTGFALHKNLGQLMASYNSGSGRKVSFVAGVGPIAERSSGQRLAWDGGATPDGLMSHSDQTLQWQTAVPNASEFAGWAGRVGERLNSGAEGVCPTDMYTLDGSGVFANGRSASPLNAAGLFSLDTGKLEANQDWSTGYVIRNATKAHSGYFDWQGRLKTRIEDAVGTDGKLSPFAANSTYFSLLQHAMSQRMHSARERGDDFHVRVVNGSFTDSTGASSELDARIRLALKIIKASTAERVIVFVSTPMGWDHHANMKENLAIQLSAVDTALNKYFGWVEQNGMAGQVMLFTASEFGRTITPNASAGSDHAWSGVQMVCGHGSELQNGVFGSHPWLPAQAGLSIAELNLDSGGLGRGVLSPAVAVDDLYRDLGKWLGLSSSGMQLVLPNLFGSGLLSGNTMALRGQGQFTTPLSWAGSGGDIGFYTPV